MTIKYRADIDGLRAIAIVSVVAYHCGLKAVSGGFVGVDIFFVISGYLIASQVNRDVSTDSFQISKFYQRRAKRILPALAGVLCALFLAALILFSPQEMKEFASSAIAAVLSASNLYFWIRSGYFSVGADLKPLLMTWSLGIEEQFYLIFPLLLFALRKVRPSRVITMFSLMALASFAASAVVTSVSPSAAFYLLPTRGWELGAGVLLALYEAQQWRMQRWIKGWVEDLSSVLGAAMIVYAVFFFDSTTRFPGSAAAMPVMGATLLIASRQGIVNRILARRPFVFIGLVSYSWYLWHWPLLSLARVCSDEDISLKTGLAIAAASFAVAVLSWKFIETPFRKSTSPPRTLLLRYAALNGMLLVAASSLWLSHGLPRRYRAAATMESSSDPFHQDRCIADYGITKPSMDAQCAPHGGGETLALLGDSHAGAMAQGLRRVASEQGYKLFEFAKASCPPVLGVVPHSVHHPGHERECSLFNSEAVRSVLGAPDVKDVFLVAFWSNYLKSGTDPSGFALVPEIQPVGNVPVARDPAPLDKGLEQMIDTLVRGGKRVWLLQDNDAFHFDPVRHMRARLIKPRLVVAGIVAPATLNWPDGIAPAAEGAPEEEARLTVARVAQRHPELTLVDPHAELCSAAGCKFAIDQSTLYIDSHHLSPLGAQLAVAGLRLPTVKLRASAGLQGSQGY